MLGLEVLGVPEVTGLLSQVDRELKQGLRERLKEAARLVRDTARANTDSRRVKSALTFTVTVKSLFDYEARVFPRGKWGFIARFLEGGTKPHLIQNFHGREGVVFQHPGMRPHPFLEPARVATEEQVVELVGIPPVLR
jgi:HK97 gp10 family phage protein